MNEERKDTLFFWAFGLAFSYSLYTVATALNKKAFDPVTAFYVYANELGLAIAIILYLLPIFFVYLGVNIIKKHVDIEE